MQYLFVDLLKIMYLYKERLGGCKVYSSVTVYFDDNQLYEFSTFGDTQRLSKSYIEIQEMLKEHAGYKHCGIKCELQLETSSASAERFALLRGDFLIKNLEARRDKRDFRRNTSAP